jgi:hypothetical protein
MNHPFDGKTVSALAQQVTTRSAVNPCLWACLVISLPLFVLSAWTDGLKSFFFFIIALLPIAAFIFSYIYLLMVKPNYLRSEEYQLRAEALEILGDKDNSLHADAHNIVSLVGITNPSLPALPAPGKDHE